jgi:hypothetical protein
MIVLHFSMQGEDIIEHIVGKCQGCLNFVMQEEDTFEQIMPSVIWVHFSQLIDHCVT